MFIFKVAQTFDMKILRRDQSSKQNRLLAWFPQLKCSSLEFPLPHKEKKLFDPQFSCSLFLKIKCY